jgi:hypothetical protein
MLQKICDALQPGTISVFFQRWLSRLPLPLDAADREGGGSAQWHRSRCSAPSCSPLAAMPGASSRPWASHWPLRILGRFLPEHTTAVSVLDNRLPYHASVVVTDGDSYRLREANAKERNHPEHDLINPRGGDF